MRLRSWGETSEVPVVNRSAGVEPDARMSRDGPPEVAHTWRPSDSWSSRPIRTTPTSGRPGPPRAGSMPDRPAGSCAAPAATRAARTRMRTRWRWPPPAKPSSGPPPRSSATPGVTFLHQPDGALANDLALREQLVREIRTFRPGRGPGHGSRDAVLPRRRREPHRPSGRRLRGGRCRLPGRAQPDGVPRPGPVRAWRPTSSAASTCSGPTGRTPASTSRPRWTARSRRSRPTRPRSASRPASPSASGRGAPRRASRSGRPRPRRCGSS